MKPFQIENTISVFRVLKAEFAVFVTTTTVATLAIATKPQNNNILFDKAE